MKNIYLLLLSTILLISCQKGQEKSNLGKENAIGTWEILPNYPSGIDHFELLANDSAKVYYRDSTKEISAKWNWKPNVGIAKVVSFSTDVLLKDRNTFLGFVLSKENGEYYLGSNNFKFKKIK
ncbi:hypothetical protein ACG2LH_07440 [Zhouia sp. PK063]|uniref:hypothetical protein n=1 Tax=Zhouia sp. PK063 TaxID=3373602 RepID=UPI003789F0AC